MSNAIARDDGPVTIRSANAADLPAIESLLQSSSLPTDGVKEALTNFLVAESGAEIVGSIGMEYVGGCALLRSAAVSAKHRGHGVARRLTEEIIARARSRGVESVYLLTTTAEAYFPKFGFEVVPRHVAPPEIRATGEFTGTCPASATLMTLSLSGPAKHR